VPNLMIKKENITLKRISSSIAIGTLSLQVFLIEGIVVSTFLFQLKCLSLNSRICK
jgi:hypothetical protein